MSEVVTFSGFTPPPRYDLLPWTQVRIEEAAAEDSSVWTLIDTIALSPLDADPSAPATRSFTTEKGTALDYWYRIYFADATGDLSQPTSPIQNTAGTTPAVRAYATTNELFRVLEIRAPTPAQTEAGQRVLDAAALEIDEWIGRSSPYPDPPALVVEVNLERAVEHWHQSQTPWGIYSQAGVPMLVSRDSWRRHAYKLLPLKESWGVA